jgi:hypothetical protein
MTISSVYNVAVVRADAPIRFREGYGKPLA